jgi:hypothetical protein
MTQKPVSAACGNSLISGTHHLWEPLTCRNSLKCSVWSRNELAVPDIGTVGGARWVPEAMSRQRVHYEPFAWWLTRERIGHDFRERYPALQELPSRLLALVEKLDASQGNQSPQEMPSGWRSKLD